MKIKKSTFIVATSFAALTLLGACQHNKSDKNDSTPLEVIDDCSGAFETRNPQNNKKVNNEKEANDQTSAECKILEIKIDDDTKCQIVGSNKINNLKQSLAQNSDDRAILIIPEKKIKETTKMLNKFLATNGIKIEKYFDVEALKNLNFPYKGLKCEIEDRKFVVWSGNKQVIATLEND